MSIELPSPRALLDAAYSDLDLESGALLDVDTDPSSFPPNEWVRKGGWLTLAKRVGAQKVFFVEDNPVIVFVEADSIDDNWHHVFNRTWCMARPPVLFLARPGQLTVYDLTRAPIREANAEDARPQRLLAVVQNAAEVAERLQHYHRSKVETGRLFEENTFSFDTRADRSLVRDLQKVRDALLTDGLEKPHAHALIGRSIFVRYLEDRRILTEPYFREIAGANADWNRLIDEAPPRSPEDKLRRAFYTSVLRSKSFTDALFARLARDFNGDLFPLNSDESNKITQPRLTLIRKFLMSEIEGEQLFFFAYDFEIVPIDLISSIYEEFLKEEKGKKNTEGSFYTPSTLVDFVLSKVLDDKLLETKPRVLDPACGSGIFLVETFQRIVRHRRRELQRELRPQELRKILHEQIAGVDINGEAIRVAAFSLYLAMLNFLNPPDILGHKLPTLTYQPDRNPNGAEHFNILIPKNAFTLKDSIEDGTVLEGFAAGAADVVVGNPPWGMPDDQDNEAAAATATAMNWCNANGRSVGDKELSQAFIQLTMWLLRKGGRAGLLVSSGVCFKRHRKSRDFRHEWLSEAALLEVVNFAAVRTVFFTGRGRDTGAIAPFASVVFEKRDWNRSHHQFRYFSAKATAFVAGLQAVVLGLPDLHIVPQQDFMRDDELWKIYWWGGHRDEALVKRLRAEEKLGRLIDPAGKHPDYCASGFKESNKNQKPVEHLDRYEELPVRSFWRYGPLPKDKLKAPPKSVERERRDFIFREGWRLLVKAGIEEKDNANGQLIARLERAPFCFRHSIYGLRLPEKLVPHAKVLLGILWSSVTRYYLWMVSGRWGMWHHDVLLDTVKSLPVRMAGDKLQKKRIERIVDQLRESPVEGGLLAPAGTLPIDTVQSLEKELDNAVFRLFGLSKAESDLIRDMCETGLDLFYNKQRSDALKPLSIPSASLHGSERDLRSEGKLHEIQGYILAFLEIWAGRLGPAGYFSWQVSHSAQEAMIAITFRTEDAKSSELREADGDSSAEWSEILKRLGQASLHPYGSRGVYINGMTRVVRENDITIIKKNERRLWTKSAARADAEAAILEAQERQRLIMEVTH